ncbi:hypothetical protein ABT352_35540 [Streptosporangium sp. NPDC000563]|uniref:hypothetical protein n=1 Tax=unclassified Streptosporangium TaxID=2632669 RepID=UPI00331C3EA9
MFVAAYEAAMWVLFVVVVIGSIRSVAKYGVGWRGQERAVLARIKRREEKRLREQERAWAEKERRWPGRLVEGVVHERAAESGVRWPVRPYVVTTIKTGSITPGRAPKSDVQEWLVNWPQLKEWGGKASAVPEVLAMAVYEDQGARISTVWTWENGRLESKVAYRGSWQSAVRAHCI